MATERFVDCQGLAGAWTLGTVQAGFELATRVSLHGGFGDQCVESNRALLGAGWDQQEGGASDEWDSVEAGYVCGTPPCSGFSLLNNSAAQARKAGRPVPKTARGPDSSINDCMKELVRYGASIKGRDGKKGADVIAFESVQQAYSMGKDLMTTLRGIAEDVSGQKYGLAHVKMSGAGIGAAQMRHRYFWVAHRIPFGIEPPQPRRVATYRDAIGDLADAELKQEHQWLPYPITDPSSMWWLEEQGILQFPHPDTPEYVIRDHYTAEFSRAAIYLEQMLPYWGDGEGTAEVLKRYIEQNGETPKGAEKWWDWDKHQMRGFGGPRRVPPDKPGYVLTGGGAYDFIHWQHPRFLTIRETARLMGYPDSWTWEAAKNANQASAWIGKCCPVQSGRWISEWVMAALKDEAPPPTAGEEVGDREILYNFTNDYKRWPQRDRQEEVLAR